MEITSKSSLTTWHGCCGLSPAQGRFQWRNLYSEKSKNAHILQNTSMEKNLLPFFSRADLRTEALGESLHAAQSRAQLHTAAVQEHTEKSMSRTGVWDQLHTTTEKHTVDLCCKA